ncbi:MAG: ribosomal protein methyltransferase [Alphaproteobacteria bacterium]|nr:ribosomal protein methyltransferase [Alphaproteobacteria bacterium]
MADSWKATLPCTRAEAEALAADIPALAVLDSPPVLMTSEADPDRPDRWRLDAYFESAPSNSDLALLRQLVPSASSAEPLVEQIADEDWVTVSQQGMEPIRAGRFFVHTPEHRAAAANEREPIEIGAGRAFGTGHHETTTGCLLALERMRTGGTSFANILDLGTGTGLLAFAALRLWRMARAAASDIDPVAVEVAAENAAANGIRLGRARGRLELAVATGLDHPRLKARGPYDLIIANILAAPLVELAPAIAAAIEPGGRVILAGLLDHQADKVVAAYRRERMMLEVRQLRGDWPTLVMRKRPARAIVKFSRKSKA